MEIRKTHHYIVEHEDEVPWETVQDVIKTTSAVRVGKDLLKFVRRSKKREVYILCAEDRQGNLKVINAKIRRK